MLPLVAWLSACGDPSTSKSGGAADPTLVSIQVKPAAVTIAQGSTCQYIATGTFSDNSTQNLSSTVKWSSAAGSVATVSSTGMATAVASGTSSVQASYYLMASNAASLAVTSVPAIFTASPTLTNSPNTDAPLVGLLHVATSRPARITLDVTDGVDSWTLPFSSYQTGYDGPVVGFRSGSLHIVQVSVTDQSGNTSQYPGCFSLTTPALPPNMPTMSVAVSNPAAMEPGLTLVEPSTLAGQYLAALDATGHIVWHYKSSSVAGQMVDARRLANGNLTFIVNNGRANHFMEITPAG
ncbi:MAG TPA: Ig-like domain-containing protein, partial [bacterium]|nr:Ig-like domain-containing protein [bacterium]